MKSVGGQQQQVPDLCCQVDLGPWVQRRAGLRPVLTAASSQSRGDRQCSRLGRKAQGCLKTMQDIANQTPVTGYALKATKPNSSMKNQLQILCTPKPGPGTHKCTLKLFRSLSIRDQKQGNIRPSGTHQRSVWFQVPHMMPMESSAVKQLDGTRVTHSTRSAMPSGSSASSLSDTTGFS